MRNTKPMGEWKNAKTGEKLADEDQKITVRALRKWQEEAKKFDLADYFEDVDPPSDGEIDTICARITDAALRKA